MCFLHLCVFLTWTVPLRAALVSIYEDSKAKQATVWRVGSVRAALGFVEQDELVVDTDVLGTITNDLCIWRLVQNNKQTKKNNKNQNKGYLLFVIRKVKPCFLALQ